MKIVSVGLLQRLGSMAALGIGEICAYSMLRVNYPSSRPALNASHINYTDSTTMTCPSCATFTKSVVCWCWTANVTHNTHHCPFLRCLLSKPILVITGHLSDTNELALQDLLPITYSLIRLMDLKVFLFLFLLLYVQDCMSDQCLLN